MKIDGVYVLDPKYVLYMLTNDGTHIKFVNNPKSKMAQDINHPDCMIF